MGEKIKTNSDIKKELVYYAKLMDEKGLVNSLEGNLSIMDKETGMLYITPSGIRKAHLNEDLIAVLKDGVQISGEAKHSSEYLLHEAALKAKDDFGAVAHMHAPYLTAYAYCGKDIELRCSATFGMLFAGKVRCLPYAQPGTSRVADGIEEALREKDMVLLANHGVVSAGKTIEDACKIIEAAEEVMKIINITKNIGPVSDISERDWESLLRDRYYINR